MSAVALAKAELPNTLSREPLRRLAPFAWAHSRARSPARPQRRIAARDVS